MNKIFFAIAFMAIVFATAYTGQIYADPWADSVVSYIPGPGADPPNDDPTKALGPDDGGFVSLGNQGSIVLEFTDNYLTGSGNADPDLVIHEIVGFSESMNVEISKDGVNWSLVGVAYGPVFSIDIDAYGHTPFDLFLYVRLTDLAPDETEPPTAGADIDAVMGLRPLIAVVVDIKPGSCPNPFNAKSKGVVPVAIVGTDTFDVTTVDPTTVTLAGVPVLEDPAPEILDSTQPEPLKGTPEDCEACFDADADLDGDGVPDLWTQCDRDTNGDGIVDANDQCYMGDGFMDLVLYFDTQALADVLGARDRDECVELTLTGMMKNGIPIVGSDSVKIRTKMKAPGVIKSLTTTWGDLKSR